MDFGSVSTLNGRKDLDDLTFDTQDVTQCYLYLCKQLGYG